MPNEITPEQREQLKTWAGQRDSLLSEISVLRTSKEGLEKTSKELASSNTNINADINKALGRIEELKKKEAELVTLQSKEISSLQVEKVGLESDVSNLWKIINILNEQKVGIEKDISLLTDTFVRVNNKTSELDKVVDHVTRVSSDNKHEIDSLLEKLKKTLGELIDVNTKNVFETNVVIEKLPQMLVEVRKQSLMRNKVI